MTEYNVLVFDGEVERTVVTEGQPADTLVVTPSPMDALLVTEAPGPPGPPGPPGADGADGSVAVQAHLDDPTPHAVYDEGPDLTLIYENAKV